MPELPEVETVVRTLEYQLQQAKIQTVQVIYPRIIENKSVSEFEKALMNEQFLHYRRKGKYLIFELERHILVCHLRMEGKFYVEPDLSLQDKHTHVIFTLQDGRYLMYHDVRKFGRMYLYEKDEPCYCLENLGLEPWDDELTVSYLKQKMNKRTMLKPFLLDQSVICGIGNIYANEICFALKVRPDTLVCTLSDQKLELLIKETRRILSQAIEAGGTTIRSYTSSLGVNGRFQLSLMVHGRNQQPCKQCGTTIVKTMLKGRGTYYCLGCQK
ncbi:MAG: DNA-formamidopyrimidine glycosylase [Erysipelotrichaceae bacterium]|nr:DNA-formamidopyrimidine glycosylase [Erysipelotrichaceae bacterium]